MPELLERLRKALADRYTLERELGQGGMATVYLAEDLRHHRKVALKVLRPELSAALGSERFLREIETTAQLTHPHILPLLDSGAATGTLFYVMPYVEGESLRDRLTRETQLPLDDALRIAREAADALAYAHSRGVIHRDIKPENILLESGHAVVADFGIARAVSAAGGERLTETGLAVGTPAYMSPEQAAGSGKLDGRSDVYSLGCVLFEMLSGETPYTGPTPQSILAKKLSEPLPRISVVREAVPAGVEAALNKALARTPADRWPTAEAFGAALAHPETVAVTPSGGITPTQTRPIIALGNVPRWGKWAAGIAAVAIVALVTTQLLKGKPLNITADVTQVTNDAGIEFEPAISPGGDEVAYVAGPIGLPRLYVRSTVNVTGGGAVRLGDTALGSEWLPAWSPDGQRVQFWSCPGAFGMALGRPCTWRETGKLGGAVQPLAPNLPGGMLTGWGMAFSPDSTLVAFMGRRDTTEGEDTLYVAPANGSGSRRVLASGQQLHSPAFSPDGARIAYVYGNFAWRTSTNAAESEILVVDTAGGPPRLVATGSHQNVSPVWLDARRLLFVSDRDGQRAVYAVEVGPKGARGEPRPIPGLSDPHSISYSAASRRLAYSKFSIQQNIWSYPLGGAAPVSIRSGLPVTTGTQMIETHDPSPDGRWIAYSGSLRGRMHLFKVPAGGGQPVLLTNYPGHEELPRWSPDGREIAFFHARPVKGNSIEVIPAQGGQPVVLFSDTSLHAFPAWGPNGLDVFFISARSGMWTEQWRVSRDSLRGPWREATMVFPCPSWPEPSPDGRGLLCLVGSVLELRGLDGRPVWRRDLAATSRLAHFGSPSPRFARDGRTVYLEGSRDGRRGVWAVPVPVGEPHQVVAYDDPSLVAGMWMSVGPDRLYLTVGQYQSDIWVARLKY